MFFALKARIGKLEPNMSQMPLVVTLLWTALAPLTLLYISKNLAYFVIQVVNKIIFSVSFRCLDIPDHST